MEPNSALVAPGDTDVGTFGGRLTWLFEHVLPPDPPEGQARRRRKTFTNEEVAAHLRAAGEQRCSDKYVSDLRAGRRDNPTRKMIEALAGFFGVSPAYFVDHQMAARIQAQIKLSATVGDLDVRLAMDTAVDDVTGELRQLSTEDLRLLREIIRSLRQRGQVGAVATPDRAEGS